MTTFDDPLAPLWELGGVTFGTYQGIGVAAFDPGAAEISDQDLEFAAGDGVLMGRDFVRPSTWAFDLFTDFDNPAEAFAAQSALTAIWRNPATRLTPGAAVPLRYRMNGRWRRVYGRPRRLAGANGGVVMLQGNAEITADFRLVSHLHYDDEASQVEVGMVPAIGGGWSFPTSFPVVIEGRLGEGGRPTQFVIGGDAPTWPVVTIHGPIKDPRVEFGDGRHIRLVGSLAYDRSVTVDTAPWARSVVRDDGAHVPGMLHSSMRFNNLALEPGPGDLTLWGIDATNTARATMSWRNAHHGL